MNILVTGCNGYIGSHVTKVLKEHGHSIIGWDIDVHGEYNDVRRYLDGFRSYDVTSKRIHDQFDAVIHLAGLAIVSESTRTPWEYYRVNVAGTHNLLSSIDHSHVIFAGTSSAWEMASPYARSKVAAEDVIKQITNDYTILRFFNVSGTNGDFRQLGQATHLIRVAAEVAAGKRSHIEIYGTDYPTEDGTCVRDYVHVQDLAEAINESVARGPARSEYECIGSNHGYSVLEILDIMEKVTGKKLNRICSARRPGDAIRSVVDNLSELITLKRSIEDMCLSQYQLECAK
jgi:UDP-glucose 4-epimerase